MSAPTDPPATRAGAGRPPWAELRAALAAVGFRPTKTLGQNFLIDPGAARSIAEDARVATGERVVEIGAGCGFLTLPLADLGVELVAIEIDARLCSVARRLLEGRPNVRLVEADALAGKHALSRQLRAELPPRGPWHLVSNLPYSISGPLLVLLSRLENPPRSMTALVQEEVAERIASRPGDPAWGALSARLAVLYRARTGRGVGPSLFWPRPRVGSRVVHLDLEPLEGVGPGDLPELDALVSALFQKRRKQLLPILAACVGGRDQARALAAEAGQEPAVRPEELAPAALLALSRSPLWRRRVRAEGADFRRKS